MTLPTVSDKGPRSRWNSDMAPEDQCRIRFLEFAGRLQTLYHQGLLPPGLEVEFDYDTPLKVRFDAPMGLWVTPNLKAYFKGQQLFLGIPERFRVRRRWGLWWWAPFFQNHLSKRDLEVGPVFEQPSGAGLISPELKRAFS